MEKKTSLLAGLARALSIGASALAPDAVKQRSLRGFEPTRRREPRAKPTKAYVDRVGMPHGSPGCKLVRRAMRGTVTVQGSRRGFLDQWSSTKVASMGLGDRRRAKG